MNREKAKELLPIIQALADGKEIEFFHPIRNEWVSTLEVFNDQFSYRIKPGPTHRPFNNKGELVASMMEIKLPFGWVRFKDLKEFSQILYISNDGIVCSSGSETVTYTYEEAFENLTFLDGSPFGVKE